MIMDVPLIANLAIIRDKIQHLINENLIRQNKKGIKNHYRKIDMVEKIVWDKTKLSKRSHGPYRILETNCNGSLTLQITPTVTDTISSRWVRPVK